MSLAYRHVGFTRFLTCFCYNFHFAPVIENHPSPPTWLYLSSKSRRLLPLPHVILNSHVGERSSSASNETKAYHWNTCLSDRSCASHPLDLSTGRVLPVSGGRAQRRLRLWQTHVGMATRCRHKVYFVSDVICARVLDPTCHRVGRDRPTGM